MSKMVGKRVYPDEFGTLHLGAGDYAKDEAGNWVVHPPGASVGTLRGAAVTEHEDKTITVPGLIDKGVWLKS